MTDSVASRLQPAREPIRLPGANTLVDGERRAVHAGGHNYLIIRDGDKLYACPNKCPHFGIKLSAGYLVGSVLECRWHHWRLDLSTGTIDAEESPFGSFETYDVVADGEDLLIAGEAKTRLRRRPVEAGLEVPTGEVGPHEMIRSGSS